MDTRKRKMTEEEVTMRVAMRRLGGVDDGDEGVFWPEPTNLRRCALVLEPELRGAWGATKFGVELRRHHDGSWCVDSVMYEDRHGVVVVLHFTPLSCDPADQESVLELAASLLASQIRESFSYLSQAEAERHGTDLIKTAREVLLELATVIADDNVEFVDQTVDELAHEICKVAVDVTAGGHVSQRIKVNALYPRGDIHRLENVADYVDLSAEPGEAQ
jgi:hypothetical protein